MSPLGGTSLDTFKDPFESRYFSGSFTLYKYGSSILQSISASGRSSICLNFMVHLKSAKQQSFQQFGYRSHGYSQLGGDIISLWAEVKESIIRRIDRSREVVDSTLPHIPGRWCFRDGSWKKHESCSGQGWYMMI